MGRLIFANQLRGLAALCVVVSHLLGVYWGMRDFVGLATSAPVQPGSPPEVVFGLISHPWLNFGPLGVAVFFLISGLVIPISLDKHSRASFAAARLLRIYPLYLAALLLEVAVLHANAAYWNRPFAYSDLAVLANALLIYNVIGQPSIDLVNWTLCIELKFYLLLLVLAPQVRAGRVAALFGVAVGIWLTNLLLAAGWLDGLATRFPAAATILSTESVFIVYMLIGVLFSHMLRGCLSRLSGSVAICLMFALFVATWRASVNAAQFPMVTANYLYGLVIFAGAFLLRRHAVAFWPLDFLTAISFPLYLIHSLIGFSLLKFFMLAWGWPYAGALALAVPLVILLATALHFGVEVHAAEWGRRLAPRQKAADIAAAAD